MDKLKKIKIALVAGGTAGHIMPLLAIHSALQRLSKEKGFQIDFVFIGNPGNYAEKFTKLNIPIKRIVSSKLRRYLSARNILELPKFIFSFFQSMWHIFLERPDVVMSKGGPSSLAPIISASLFRIPVVIHESDATPSVTTKLSARFSRVIFLAFNEAKKGLAANEQKKCEVVGNPLRSSLLENISEKHSAKKALSFNPEKPLVVIIGGSQGSRRINNLIVQIVPGLSEEGIQILHQTGSKLFNEVKEAVKNPPDSYHLTEFFNEDIKEVFAAADLIISRAGSSIFEFAAFGAPSILIPLPEAAQNHQVLNASVYKDAGACVVIEEKDLSLALLTENINRIITDKHLAEEMSFLAKEFAKPEAARRIAEKLIELADD